MAYIDFQLLGGAMAAERQDHAAGLTCDPVPAASERLTALEWSVVAIARKDGAASLRRPGRVSAAWRSIFRRPNPRLADGRLEALRRMAVLSWRNGYTVPSREVSSFFDAGFTPAQYDAMVNRISASRAISPKTVKV